MTATISFYNKYMVNLGNGKINMSTDVIKVALVNNYVFDPTHETYLDFSEYELDDQFGYVEGGKPLSLPTWEYDVDDERTEFDASDVTWSATGGAIGPATGAVIYSSTSADKNLICYIDFGQVELADEDTDFKVSWHSDGIFLIS